VIAKTSRSEEEHYTMGFLLALGTVSGVSRSWRGGWVRWVWAGRVSYAPHPHSWQAHGGVSRASCWPLWGWTGI